MGRNDHQVYSGRRPLHAIVLLAAVIGASCSSSSDKDCSVMGCDANMATQVAIAADYATIAGSTLEVCRNGACETSSLSTVPDLKTTEGAGLQFPTGDGHPVIGVTIWKTGTDAYRIDVQYTAWSRADLANGDTYRVRLTSSSGQLIGGLEKSVVYKESYPNGPECDPIPCRTVKITP